MKKDYKPHSKKFMFDNLRVSQVIRSIKRFYSESESSTFSLLYLFVDFISVSGVTKVGD